MSNIKNPNCISDYFPNWKYVKPFAVGGTAGCLATMVVQPIDRLKTEIQARTIDRNPNRGVVQVASSILKNEGPMGFYVGLSAGLLRQLTYGTSRLGIFRSLTNHYSENGAKKLDFATSTYCSIIAGSLGALIGNPADVALIRMQTQSKAAGEVAYRHVGDCMWKMLTQEGVGSFFSGATPTIIRGIALNVGMLASYDHFKHFFGGVYGSETDKATLISSSIGSGITGATFCLPFDLIKTRMQKNKGSGSGLVAMGKAAADIYRSGGPLAFYSGYVPFLFRIAPHVVLVWLGMEALNASKILK